MHHRSVRAFIVLAMSLAVLISSATPAPTETKWFDGVRMKFTVTVASTYGREQPDWNAKKVASLLNKQSFFAVGRTADGLWLLIDYPGVESQVWVAAKTGKVEGGV